MFDLTRGIVFIIVLLSIYVLGLYLHYNIVRTSKKDKDVTWKLDVTNSFFIVSHYTHVIFFYSITYTIQDIYLYTGEWLCYFYMFLIYYGERYVTGYSLILAMMKYVLIVQWKKVIDIGKDKILTTFFWLNILHPFCAILIHVIITPNFFWEWNGYSQVDRCLGDPKNNWGPNSNQSQTKLHIVFFR